MEDLRYVPAPCKNLSGIFAAALLFLICLFTATQAQARVELQPCKNSISPEQQIALGRKSVQQVYREMPVLPDSSKVTQYVQALGQKLAAQAPGYHWPYNFHVVNVADINAFALPGGSIFVNLGTIRAASDEAQLAGVMAHEISHVVLEHSVCNLEKERRVGVLAGLGQIASGVILGDSAVGALAEKSIGLTAGLSFLRMSRGAEQQADLEGVGILYDAGYDPRAMPQFFEIVEAKYGKGGAQLLSDHPNPGNRTEYIDREISTFVPRTDYVTNSTQFAQIHKVVADMHTYTAQEVASGAWKRKDPNQTADTGVNQYDGGATPDTQVDTGPPQAWLTFQGRGFTMLVPSNWRAVGSRDAAMVAPPGGIEPSAGGQAGNLVYGVLTSVYRPGQGVDSSEIFYALMAELTRENPGTKPGPVSGINLGDVAALSAHTVNPSANGGRGEHDWIVGVPQGGGAMRYFVCVSPEPDFNAMRPTFEHIVNSIRLE